ncbi:MAG: hypothetical protein J5633_07260, partial [Oscillospiraceae bacterium]|nr:hypothetical protein [Oscillospiraceae bacterium]
DETVLSMLDLSWKFSPFMAVVCVAATSYHVRVEFPFLFVSHHLYHITDSPDRAAGLYAGADLVYPNGVPIGAIRFVNQGGPFP